MSSIQLGAHRSARIAILALPSLVFFATGCNDEEKTSVDARASVDSRAVDHGEAVDQGAAKDDAAPDLAAYFQGRFGLSLSTVYWGELHCHTSYSLDAAGCTVAEREKTLAPDLAYEYARDTQKLDFVMLSDHAEEPNPAAMPKEHRDQNLSNWESLHLINAQYNAEAAGAAKPFLVFAGWEYTNTHGLQPSVGSATGYGHKNVVFKPIDPKALPAVRYGALKTMGDALAVNAPALWQRLAAYRPTCAGCEGTAFTIVHTPAAVGDGGSGNDSLDHRTDWGTMDADFSRHVEVCSKWGCFEGPPPAAAGCPAEQPYQYTASAAADPLAIRAVLYERWVEQGDARFVLGFVGGTDNHQGMAANDIAPQCQMNHFGTLTGVAASSKSRDAIWSGLWKRHTLASTTGVRVPALLAVETKGAHLLMGEQGSHDGTAKVRVLADAAVKKLELVVDGCLVKTVQSASLDESLTLAAGRHFLYARLWVDKGAGDSRPAWTSPVYLGEPK